MRKVCIIQSKRTPFCRSFKAYQGLKNKDLVSPVLQSLVSELNLKGQTIGEMFLGAVNKRSSDFSLARECLIESGLSLATPATDIQKACATSLEAALIIAQKIQTGQIESGIAAGVDTNSDIPVEFSKPFSDILVKVNAQKTPMAKMKQFLGLRPSHLIPKLPAIKEPRTGLSMGESCELMARAWQIPRTEQDELAYHSHMNAAKAYERGFFDDQVISFRGLKKDDVLRAKTSIEGLSKLRPAFDKTNGTLTAGNSSALTDGASAIFLCSEDYAKEHGFEVKAYLTMGVSKAVNYLSDDYKNHGLLFAPTYAIDELLFKNKLQFSDIDLFEIHEAFSAQVLCTLKALESDEFCKNILKRDQAWGKIPREKLNINGGSLALGHPFAATGARILGSLAKSLQETHQHRGLISICTAGGMGVVALVER